MDMQNKRTQPWGIFEKGIPSGLVCRKSGVYNENMKKYDGTEKSVTNEEKGCTKGNLYELADRGG